MIRHVASVLFCVSLVYGQSCYWNDGCSYQLFSSKTPYDTIRGDIRDFPIPESCEAVSLWTLNRHGNRNPGSSVSAAARIVAQLKDEIIESYYAGRGELCAQDIDDFKKWSWNATIDVSPSYLTATGYEELYDIAQRLREKYPQLLAGNDGDYYLRPTNEQRTVTSAIAFAHGWSVGSNLSLAIDGPWDRDDIIRSYQNCDRYQQEVRGGQSLEDQVNAYFTSPEFVTVQRNVQRRLGINTQLSTEDVYSIYEICRFYRSWEPNLKSPWCSAFTNDDLVVVEYRDDVRHYHRNGYGSWVNVNLGGPALKDLYENMESAVQGGNRKLTAYFTHDTMIEMVICAMGLFKDNYVLQGGVRNTDRLWRTSYIGAFSANIVAVLNRCTASGTQSYRVQIFINEKLTYLCPLEGCSWQEFQNHFQSFLTANLDFCSMDNKITDPPSPLPDSAAVYSLSTLMLMSCLVLIALRL